MAPVRWLVTRSGVIAVGLGRHVSGVRGGWHPCQPKTQSSLDLDLSRALSALRQLSRAVSIPKPRLVRKRRVIQKRSCGCADCLFCFLFIAAAGSRCVHRSHLTCIRL